MSDDRYQNPPSFSHEAQGHSFAFFARGEDRLAALLEMIETAERSILLFFYMFQHDASGSKVRDALVGAASRGVEVKLIIDDFGSDAPDRFFDPLVEAGGEFLEFSARWSVRYLVRNHQKFVIVDGERVMTGGFNISDHYFNPPSENGWCDLGVTIEGPVVAQFSDWFGLLREWVRSDGSELRRIREMVRDWDGGKGAVQLLVGGPLVRRSRWASRFRRDLAKAKRFDGVTAYFSPPRSIRRQLAKIASAGAVRLITAGVTDHRATIDMARLLYSRLLQAGVKIYEFQATKLHMKLMVIDNASYFGSANLDKRSVRLNVELMVRVKDEALAQRLRELIDHLEAASEEITPEWYARKGDFLTCLKWRITYLAALADYGVTRSLTRQ